jgi:starch synthase
MLIVNSSLRILYVTSEMTPLLSTGGLAEVAAALPPRLQAAGHDIRVAMPCYRQIPYDARGAVISQCEAPMEGGIRYGALHRSTVPGTSIPLYLIEHEDYFGRDDPYGSSSYEYLDNGERFSFFCRALLDGMEKIDWQPDIIHCNDWQAAALSIFLKTQLQARPFWQHTATVMTIHNLAFQGRFAPERLPKTGLDLALYHSGLLEYERDVNLLKGALILSDQINTVSPRYAQEIQTVEYGAGLHEILASRHEDLYGILNGVDYDQWHPARDPLIAATYSHEHMEGKAYCKAALQDLFNLPRSNVPIFGLVSRLHWQKGIDLIVDSLEQMAQQPLQLVVLGTGEGALEEKINQAARRYPDKVAVYLGFDAQRAHAVQAGSDFFLMPSRYEPCGLGQLYALAYGTVPIVRRTGGLADTVYPWRPDIADNSRATGISFVPQTPQALYRSVEKALALYDTPKHFQAIQQRGMTRDYSWKRSCEDYITLYQRCLQKKEQS